MEGLLPAAGFVDGEALPGEARGAAGTSRALLAAVPLGRSVTPQWELYGVHPLAGAKPSSTVSSCLRLELAGFK